MRKTCGAALLAILIVSPLWLHALLAQQEGATYIKGAVCVACHKALNKDLVERYQQTKHAKAVPEEEMQAVEVYRRSVAFNPADNSFLEPGVGCQACHGPGSAHVGAKTQEKAATTVRVDKLDTPHKKLSVCGRCHGKYTVAGQPFAAQFKPGEDMFALEGFTLQEVADAGPFWQLNDLMKSKHVDNDVTCITCHTAHEPTEVSPQLRKAVPGFVRTVTLRLTRAPSRRQNGPRAPRAQPVTCRTRGIPLSCRAKGGAPLGGRRKIRCFTVGA